MYCTLTIWNFYSKYLSITVWYSKTSLKKQIFDFFLISGGGGYVHYTVFAIYEGLRQKRRQMSSLLFEGRTWMSHYSSSSKDDLNKSFLDNIYFGRVVVWYGAKWTIIHFFKASIPPSSFCPLFNSSFSSNHPGGKSVVRHGIEWIPSPKQQQRPMPSLLSDSSSMVFALPHYIHLLCGIEYH